MMRKYIICISLLMASVCSLYACNTNVDVGIEEKDEAAADEDGEEMDDTAADEGSKDKEDEEQRAQLPIDLYGTYDQNDLLVNTLEIEYEGIVLELPQIEGLKDKAVQEQINQDILQQSEAVYKELEGIRFLSHNVMANFSNVLSINVYMGGEASDSSKQIHLNYDLNTGEELMFEDLFLSEADPISIIHQAFRKMLITNQMQGDYDENELYKIVKSYAGSKKKAFAFTPTSILMYYKDMVASVKMMDVADEVAVYSRYLSEESLFERGDIGRKDVFTCMDIPEQLFEVWEYGQLEENLWYDFIALDEYFSEVEEEMHMEEYLDFSKEMYDTMYSEIDTYRQIAKEHPESFYILLMKPLVRMEIESEWNGDAFEQRYTGRALVSKNTQWIEIPRDKYDEVYKEKIHAAYRYEYLALAGGIYLDASEEYAQIEYISEELTYDYLTKEQVRNEELMAE